MRVGLGRDVHRLVAGGRLILGGVVVSENLSPVAHSDGDCLLHALMDAILGAAALPNVGVLFPCDGEENRGRDSCEMLGTVLAMVWKLGFRLVNVDAVIQLEAPPVSSFFPAMRERLSPLLGLEGSAVGLKATTAEGLGPIGRGEALEVLCVCLLEGGKS
ncbi:MAG: 2-C-methyl-D-erythritol 2,4-cyclodiphosphate synthase [Puniceicoccales bacterium]|jgi:2-C-methyl-D-erythritol 2,4-cyclodiphosphate synthase|nr:2-C-methyl-D-erythritol 2,4-cyclodiphosphate synthase [Puniceicoccales bacterium]